MNTTTIKLAYEHKAHRTAIEALAELKSLHDPNWSGTEFRVELDDFTCIEDCDEIAGAALLAEINDLVY